MLKFRDVLSRWERRELSMMEAGELLGMSERQFRRYRDRFEDEGETGLIDRRLGKPSEKRIEAAAVDRMLELYRKVYGGWNVKHFHEHGVRDHKFTWDASAQARAQALRRHDAAPGRLTAPLAYGAGAARSDRHDG
jgi:LmbE family N-acetylglucosaminyl deacetylase